MLGDQPGQADLLRQRHHRYQTRISDQVRIIERDIHHGRGMGRLHLAGASSLWTIDPSARSIIPGQAAPASPSPPTPNQFRRWIRAEIQVGSVSYVDKRTNETRVAENVERRVWTITAAPIFTQDRVFLAAHIPSCPDTGARAVS